MTTAASKLAGSRRSPPASSETSNGAAITPRMQVTSSVQTRTVATLSTRRRVASSPSRSRAKASVGTNAWLNAPSPNRRRNRLGMRKATLKASVIAVAPKVAAISRSRIRPVTRDARVISETVEAALSRDTGTSVAPGLRPIPQDGPGRRDRL